MAALDVGLRAVVKELPFGSALLAAVSAHAALRWKGQGHASTVHLNEADWPLVWHGAAAGSLHLDIRRADLLFGALYELNEALTLARDLVGSASLEIEHREGPFYFIHANAFSEPTSIDLLYGLKAISRRNLPGLEGQITALCANEINRGRESLTRSGYALGLRSMEVAALWRSFGADEHASDESIRTMVLKTKKALGLPSGKPGRPPKCKK
jgi:hypothetical protein